ARTGGAVVGEHDRKSTVVDSRQVVRAVERPAASPSGSPTPTARSNDARGLAGVLVLTRKAGGNGERDGERDESADSCVRSSGVALGECSHMPTVLVNAAAR